MTKFIANHPEMLTPQNILFLRLCLCVLKALVAVSTAVPYYINGDYLWGVVTHWSIRRLSSNGSWV